jgi:hypothetical protein
MKYTKIDLETTKIGRETPSESPMVASPPSININSFITMMKRK